MPLFATYQELQKYLPVTENFKMEVFLSSLRQADRAYLYPAVSKDLYDYLRVAAAGSGLSSMETEAYDLLREAEAQLGFHRWITLGQVNISSSGIRIANTDNWKTAFQWQIQDLKNTALQDGLGALEDLIGYLNDNLSAFPVYRDSDQYAENYSGFINSGREFSAYFSVAYPRYTFLRTTPIRHRVEREAVRTVLGAALADEIVGQLADQALSPANESIIGFIRGAVANLTIAKSVVELSVHFSDKGITVFSDSGTTGTIEKREPAPDNRLDNIIKSCTATGESYIKRLRTFLQSNSGQYPLYTPVTDTPTFNNAAEGGFFTVFT